MSDFYERNRDGVNKAVIITVFVAGVFIFVKYAFSYVAPFVFGYLISLLLNPIATFIHGKPGKFRIGKGIAALISLLLLFALIGVVGTSLVTKIIYEARAFIANVPFYLSELTKALEELMTKYRDLIRLAPIDLRNSVPNLSDAAVSAVTGLLGTGVRTGSVNIVSFIPGMILGALLSIISAFFFIRDSRRIYGSFVKITPGWLSSNIALIRKCLISAIGGYYRAQILIGCIVGAMCMTGLAILRYPYALFLGFIIIVLDTLPMVGCGAVFWPWIVMSLITGNYTQTIGLLIIYAIVFVTRQLIEPRILGGQIGVHPLLTLMSMYVGLKVFGVLGVIIGPVVITTVKVILDTDITFTRRTVSNPKRDLELLAYASEEGLTS